MHQALLLNVGKKEENKMVASVVKNIYKGLKKTNKTKKRKAAEDKINNIVLKNAAKKQGIVPKKQQKELLKKAKARFVDRNYLKGK